ncbi:DUF2694 family protein [Williamsia sp. SKLECPSW1]
MTTRRTYEYYEDWDDDEPEDSQAEADAEASADQPGGEHSLQTVGRAATPSGSVEVRTTQQGLPTAIHIERSEMDKSATSLARTILLLCRQASNRAGAEARRQLLAEGHSLEAVSYLNLPTERDVTAADLALDAHLEESEPDTWMRRV